MNLKSLKLIFSASVCGSILIAVSGCSSEPEPVRNSGFLPDPELMNKNNLVPVQRLWRNPSIRTENYNKIIIQDVDTSHIMTLSGTEGTNIRDSLGDTAQDTKDFAKYLSRAFKEAIQNDKDHRFELVTTAGPNTMVLQMALVKVVPAKPIYGAVKNITNLTPIGLIIAPVKMGVQAESDSGMQSSVAIEGRIIDSMTGTYICMFADRRKQSTAFINFNDFTAYGNAEQIADKWAKNFIEILKKRPIETNTPYKLNSLPVGIVNY